MRRPHSVSTGPQEQLRIATGAADGGYALV